MSTSFPTSIDTFTNPSATDPTTSPSHADQHADANDAIEALEAKVGANSSAVNTSHDFKLSSVADGDKASSLMGAETLTNKILTTPRINTPKFNEDIEMSATSTELNYNDGVTPGTSSANKTAILGSSENLDTLVIDEVLEASQGFKFNAPQGFMVNGMIVTSVSSNNITIAIKTLDDNDPSATNPVYIRIGNTVRAITASLSVTRNAGTNWFGSGSSETATEEIDYFVYIGYNTTDGMTIGFARVSYGRVYGDFSATSTDSDYCAISDISNATSTDEYELVGRFNAVLSETSSFNWSIPATSIIYNQPIRETRYLAYTPEWITVGTSSYGNAVINCKYQVRMEDIQVIFNIEFGGTTNFGTSSNWRFSLPIEFAMDADTVVGALRFGGGGSNSFGNFETEGTKAMQLISLTTSGSYPTPTATTYNVPGTWSSGNYIKGVLNYSIH